MARQTSIYTNRGNVGNANLYKTKGGYQLREKGGVIASRIKTDPAFTRTRENMAEFGYAVKAGQLLRRTFKPVIKNSADKRVSNRITQRVRLALNGDTDNVRGSRILGIDNVLMLENFNFNGNAPLEEAFASPYTLELNRATGAITVNIATFIPESQIDYSTDATHFRMVAAAAAIDFAASEKAFASVQSDLFPLDNNFATVDPLSLSLPAASTDPIFVVLGIEFFQEVNGVPYLLRNGMHNAIQIIQVAV